MPSWTAARRIWKIAGVVEKTVWVFTITLIGAGIVAYALRIASSALFRYGSGDTVSHVFHVTRAGGNNAASAIHAAFSCGRPHDFDTPPRTNVGAARGADHSRGRRVDALAGDPAAGVVHGRALGVDERRVPGQEVGGRLPDGIRAGAVAAVAVGLGPRRVVKEP